MKNLEFPWRKTVHGVRYSAEVMHDPQRGRVIAIRIDECLVVAPSVLSGAALTPDEWLTQLTQVLARQVASSMPATEASAQ